MALLQISEPGKSTMPHEHRRVVGIDLGTTNSLVASVISGSPAILIQDNESNLLPSVVYYSKNTEQQQMPIADLESRDWACSTGILVAGLHMLVIPDQGF